MIVRFHGTRGTTPHECPPALIRQKLVGALFAANGRVFADRAAIGRFVDTELPPECGPGFGGATPCVEVLHDASGDEVVLLDAGTGLAAFGRHWKKDARSARPATFHILLSHLHWDHIQGIPFFEPAYSSGNRIVFHACHAEAEGALRAQMTPPFSAVSFGTFRAAISFVTHRPGEKFPVAGLTAEAIARKHPGMSYAYRLEGDGKSLVYATDAEHAPADIRRESPFVAFAHGADLLIFEAMFTRDDVNRGKAGWGHASNFDAVELAALAGVGRLALFHHDPASDDARLADFEADARRYAAKIAGQPGGRSREVFMARDGMEVAF